MNALEIDNRYTGPSAGLGIVLLVAGIASVESGSQLGWVGFAVGFVLLALAAWHDLQERRQES